MRSVLLSLVWLRMRKTDVRVESDEDDITVEGNSKSRSEADAKESELLYDENNILIE